MLAAYGRHRRAASMREYRNAVMDNGRWAGFEPRPGDVFVCTPSKCGTTWMQVIVANLLWPDGEFPGPIVNGICPWIEAKFMPADAMHEMLGKQTELDADQWPAVVERCRAPTGAGGTSWMPKTLPPTSVGSPRPCLPTRRDGWSSAGTIPIADGRDERASGLAVRGR